MISLVRGCHIGALSKRRLFYRLHPRRFSYRLIVRDTRLLITNVQYPEMIIQAMYRKRSYFEENGYSHP